MNNSFTIFIQLSFTDRNILFIRQSYHIGSDETTSSPNTSSSHLYLPLPSRTGVHRIASLMPPVFGCPACTCAAGGH